MTIELTTEDGRTLDVLDAGPRDGLPFVFHHGTPQGAVACGIIERPAVERGLRVISYSRPGYGTSSPRPDGSVADDARDTASILDRLGLGEFVTLGWSGGGPRALACAAVLPDRCLAATCGVGPVPFTEYDGDFRAGMGVENVEEFGAAMDGPEALTEWLEANGTPMFSVSADGVADALGSLAPPVDRAAITGELAEWLAATGARAGEQGVVGWRDDDLTMLRPWGFDLAAIRVPTAVWQGTKDVMVPFAHAEWLATHVAGTRAHLVEGEGHLSLFMRMPDILDDLLDLARPLGG